MLPKEVFLSHATEDRATADRIAASLRAHGIAVWYAPHAILAAQQWHDEIGAALRRCDWFVLLLSPASVASMWVKRELCYALEQQRYWNRISPLLLGPCDFGELSWTLSSIQMLDFAASADAALTTLLRPWGILFQNQIS